MSSTISTILSTICNYCPNCNVDFQTITEKRIEMRNHLFYHCLDQHDMVRNLPIEYFDEYLDHLLTIVYLNPQLFDEFVNICAAQYANQRKMLPRKLEVIRNDKEKMEEKMKKKKVEEKMEKMDEESRMIVFDEKKEHKKRIRKSGAGGGNERKKVKVEQVVV